MRDVTDRLSDGSVAAGGDPASLRAAHARRGTLRIDPVEGFTPHDHELATAERLVAAGFDVEFLAPLREPGVKNPDVRIDGEPWEMKSPTGGSKHTVSNNVRRAGHQADRMVLDTARTPLADASTLDELHRRIGQSHLVEIIMIDKSGTIHHVKRP